MVELNFNANEVEPVTDFEPIPPGHYPAVVSATERKPIKDKPGWYLNLTFTVIDGEYKNRKVWGRLHLGNPSADAQRIAKGQLSALCRAVGVMTPGDSSELFNLPLQIHVVCKPRQDGNGLANEVSGFAPIGGASNHAAAQPAPAPAGAPATAATAPQAASGAKAPPWSR